MHGNEAIGSGGIEMNVNLCLLVYFFRDTLNLNVRNNICHEQWSKYMCKTHPQLMRHNLDINQI